MTIASGIHHITAIASDPKRNHDFYTRLLGLRFIKKTVNFDDPGTYHFYFADAVGSPGTVLTFFPHPGLPQGRPGVGQAVEIAFAVPRSAFPFWLDRFNDKAIDVQGPENRFGEPVLRIADPDGLTLEFIGVDDAAADNVWATDEIDTSVAIRGFHSVSLWVTENEGIAAILTGNLGFKLLGHHEGRYRFGTGLAGFGQIVDLRCMPDTRRGVRGAGTIHHVAFRVGGDDEETIIRQALLAAGHNLTPVIDRKYFHSVYFREPGGVLFELATDHPGFTVDEPLQTLGQTLQIPPHHQSQRDAIIAALPPLD